MLHCVGGAHAFGNLPVGDSLPATGRYLFRYAASYVSSTVLSRIDILFLPTEIEHSASASWVEDTLEKPTPQTPNQDYVPWDPNGTHSFLGGAAFQNS